VTDAREHCETGTGEGCSDVGRLSKSHTVLLMHPALHVCFLRTFLSTGRQDSSVSLLISSTRPSWEWGRRILPSQRAETAMKQHRRSEELREATNTILSFVGATGG